MLRPISDRVIIRRDLAPGMSGRLHIPEQAQESLLTGTVIAAGPDCLTVQDGDRVIFEKYAGSEVKDDGETLLIVSEGEVLATMEDDDG